ncbi:MAG: alpha-xylosidase, partial [Bacteroidota bacterium]|nr:alpha-xylosidase [Bacteroidota bacterium]
TFENVQGKKILTETVNGSVFTPVKIDSGPAWTAQQFFKAENAEAFYGLGQHQQGLMNYRGQVVTLAQYNSEIAIPMVVSSRNYGILWDNYSITTFGDGRKMEPLDHLTLFNPGGNQGALTATYYQKGDSGRIWATREESRINYDYISDLTRFPDSFSLDKGAVTWSGYLETDTSGKYTFRFRYGGYLKVWMDDSLVLDGWRQCWNPKTSLVPLELRAKRKYAIKLKWIPDGGQSFISCNYLPPQTRGQQSKFGFQSEAAYNIDYYFIGGKDPDGVIAGYRTLTGKAQILPEWTMGLWQSRERYKTQRELISTVQRFRELKVPLDNIVLDWQYWKPDEWGSQQFDASRFPDPKGMVDSLHHLYHTHLMVSVWPKFYEGIPNYELMKQKGYLLMRNIEEGRKDWLGYVSTFYDAFNPAAGKLFWSLVDRHLYRLGIDAFWMDASEPDIYSNLSVSQRKELLFPNTLGSATRYFNAYPLLNARAIYLGERQEAPDRRVFILTRSAYAGSQRYAAAVWSGDIGSRWDDLKNQISAGVNFSLSGNPWWTMDIGGFAVEHRYEQPGSTDLAEWRELMNRWYQFGAFCPLFRVHGQFPYREIFNVSPPGSPTYESMRYYDRLRYRLLPYFYSLNASVYFKDGTFMRGLVMDFGSDPMVRDIADEFMCGSSMLVSPVYTKGAVARKVYLPKGNGWFDLYSGAYYRGGQT